MTAQPSVHRPALTLAHVAAPAPMDKPGWRALARRLRRASTTRHQHGAVLAEALAAFAVASDAQLVGLYHPIGAEVDTRPLANALLAAGISVAYPRLRADDVSLDFVACAGPSALVTRPRSRLMEPAGPALDSARIDLLVTPALAVNAALVRLGQGGGSYDRYLPTLRDDAVVVAAVAAACCLPWGPVHRHDRAVQLVCTEAGLFAAAMTVQG